VAGSCEYGNERPGYIKGEEVLVWYSSPPLSAVVSLFCESV
jgi:hypothetical protein